MEAPRFQLEDLVEAAVEVTEEYSHESDTEGSVGREGEIATRALNRNYPIEVDTPNDINAIH